MPIILIWNEAAAPYAKLFGSWLKEMERSTLLFHLWLRPRLDEARKLDRISAAFPVFRYYNQALTARVTGVQFGALLNAPVSGVGAHMERALHEWNLPEDVRVQARSATLPVVLLDVLEQITNAVLGSLDRFAKPTPEMFDPRRRTGSDLIGIAALTFRTIGENRDGLLAAAQRVRKILPFGTDATGKQDSVSAASPESDWFARAYTIDEIARYVAGALLAIPALAQLFRRIGADALLLLRFKLLEELRKVETIVHAHRREIFVMLRSGMAAFAETALQFMGRLTGMAAGFIKVFADIGVEYLRGLTDGVSDFAGRLNDLWKDTSKLIRDVITLSTAIIGVDIGGGIHLALSIAEGAIDGLLDDDDKEKHGYKAPKQFPVTIEQLVLGEGPGRRAIDEIHLATTRLKGAIAKSLSATLITGLVDAIGMRLAGLEVLDVVLHLPRRPPATQPTLTFDASKVPDLAAQVIEPLRSGLQKSVGDIGVAADKTVGDVFGAAQTAFAKTAVEFSDASAKAAKSQPAALIDRLTGNTDQFLVDLFGDQEKTRNKTGTEAVATAFEAWLVQGGFDTLGKAAAGYTGFVLDEWLQQIAENRDLPFEVTPTSPKKLLQRAELGRVHVPRIRIDASSRPLGRDLANQIAGDFRRGVQGAYGTGVERLRQHSATAQ